jgi:TrpR-related protein YerC/YecD
MAEEPRHPWLTSEIEQLCEAMRLMRSVDELERFLRDLCTVGELETLAHRWQVAQYLDQGLPYHEVAQKAGASTTTVTRVAQWLKRGEGGYRLALDRLHRKRRSNSR